MKGNYACPNCSGTVVFQSSIAVFAVCPFCRSMVVRTDVAVESLGQMAQLPPDLSPLQIGTNGELDGLGFTLIGRVRLAYDEGSWNEWCALFSDGRYGWVAEAQGFFMVSFETPPPKGFPQKVGGLPVASETTIAGTSYQVTDKKDTTCLGSEGELPFLAPPNRTATSLDLSGAAGQFAGVEFSEDGQRLFVGRYARFDDLKFSKLRDVPGWSPNAPEPRRTETAPLNCPQCGAAVVVRAEGFTMSATCGSCRSLIDTATPTLRLIRRAREQQTIDPLIPLGRRGVLAGVNYEVIGLQVVKDGYGGWHEYLLFNPWQGFVWLVTYRGHWSFVRRLYEQPEVTEGIFTSSVAHAKFNGESYRIFAASEVSTSYVLGEFYWKVVVGMKAHLTDYVCPPRILSREAYPHLGEQTWSQGEYLAADVVAKAFNLEAPLPEPTGPYLNQPNPYAEKVRQLKWLVPLLIVALFVTQFISASRAAREQVFTADFQYQAGVTNAAMITEPFEIKGGQQAIQYDLWAPVNNNWIEFDLDLVNADTHQVAASCVQGVEYYSGYDDGPWSEGSPTEAVLIPAVAPGKYYLMMDVSADAAVTEIPFKVTVVRDVVVWSNFWIAFVLLLAYPSYCWLRAYAFERARWLESDFTPSIYAANTADDD